MSTGSKKNPKQNIQSPFKQQCKSLTAAADVVLQHTFICLMLLLCCCAVTAVINLLSLFALCFSPIMLLFRRHRPTALPPTITPSPPAPVTPSPPAPITPFPPDPVTLFPPDPVTPPQNCSPPPFLHLATLPLLLTASSSFPRRLNPSLLSSSFFFFFYHVRPLLPVKLVRRPVLFILPFSSQSIVTLFPHLATLPLLPECIFLFPPLSSSLLPLLFPPSSSTPLFLSHSLHQFFRPNFFSCATLPLPLSLSLSDLLCPPLCLFLAVAGGPEQRRLKVSLPPSIA